jgi:ElaB/YqjD/DUF883 family membrane-anchored ribosome-binding protein
MDMAIKVSLWNKDYILAESIAQKMIVYWPKLKADPIIQIEDALAENINLLYETCILQLGKAAQFHLENKESQRDAYQMVKAISTVFTLLINGNTNPENEKKLASVQSCVHDIEQELFTSVQHQAEIMQNKNESAEHRIQNIQEKINSLLDPSDLTYAMTMDKRVAKAMSYMAEWEIIEDQKEAIYYKTREKVIQLGTYYGVDGWKRSISEANCLLDNGYFEQAQYLLDDLDVIANSKIDTIDSSYGEIKQKSESIRDFMVRFNDFSLSDSTYQENNKK